MVSGKITFGRGLFICINTILLILVAVITLYPFLYVMAASVSDSLFLIQGKVGIIPKGFTLAAYRSVLEYPMIGRSYANTLFYVLAGTFINMLLTVLGAYPLSRQQFMGRRAFNFMLVFTMWLNGGMIPLFLVVKGVGLYNSIWALLLPTAISTYNLIIVRTYFQQIPKELEEASLIDGCNDMQTLFKVILPLSVPTLSTVGLFYLVGNWNSFMPALMYLRDKELYPLQMILREIVLLSEVDDLQMQSEMGQTLMLESVKYATIVVATIPVLCVYPFIQKYFVKGVMIGAVKG